MLDIKIVINISAPNKGRAYLLLVSKFWYSFYSGQISFLASHIFTYPRGSTNKRSILGLQEDIQCSQQLIITHYVQKVEAKLVAKLRNDPQTGRPYIM